VTARAAAIAPMKAARSHFAAAVHGGRLFVFGGGGADFTGLEAAEAYDPRTDRWEAIAPMPAPRSGIAAACAGDRIYVCGGGVKRPDGGFDFKSVVEVYLPLEDRWEAGPSLRWRHDAPAMAVAEGRVLLFGGHHPDATGGPLTDPGFDVCEALGNDGWREAAPMPTARFSLAAEAVGPRVWCMGGGAYRDGAFHNLDLIEAYDPSADRWEACITRLPWPAAGPATAMHGGRLYVAGGNDGERITDRVARFDPGTATWEDLPSLPEARVMAVLADVGDRDGGLILAGGRGPDGKTPTAACFRLGA
jgi:serine/threonine-protein kinase PknK